MVIIIMNKLSVAIRLTNGTPDLFEKFSNEYLMGVVGSNSYILEFSIKKLKEEVGFDKINWLEMHSDESLESILGKDFNGSSSDTRLSLTEEVVNDIDYIQSILGTFPIKRVYRAHAVRAIMVALFKTGVMDK